MTVMRMDSKEMRTEVTSVLQMSSVVHLPNTCSVPGPFVTGQEYKTQKILPWLLGMGNLWKIQAAMITVTVQLIVLGAMGAHFRSPSVRFGCYQRRAGGRDS